MPEQTPDNTFEYPQVGEYPWYKDGTQIEDPDTGQLVTQDGDGIINWLEQIEARAARVVATKNDLPANNADIQDHVTGKNRHFLVIEDREIVYDNGQDWVTIVGMDTTGVETVFNDEQATSDEWLRFEDL